MFRARQPRDFTVPASGFVAELLVVPHRPSARSSAPPEAPPAECNDTNDASNNGNGNGNGNDNDNSNTNAHANANNSNHVLRACRAAGRLRWSPLRALGSDAKKVCDQSLRQRPTVPSTLGFRGNPTGMSFRWKRSAAVNGGERIPVEEIWHHQGFWLETAEGACVLLGYSGSIDGKSQTTHRALL